MHRQTVRQTHTHKLTCLYSFTHMHTQSFTNTNILYTDSELGELYGGRPRVGAYINSLSVYNPRWIGSSLAISLSPLQLTMFLEWTMYPRTSPRHCGGKTSAGLGFLREIALKLSALSIQCAVTDVLTVPVEGQGEKSWERERESTAAEEADDETEKMWTSEEVESPRRKVWVWLAPKVLERMMVLLESLFGAQLLAKGTNEKG